MNFHELNDIHNAYFTAENNGAKTYDVLKVRKATISPVNMALASGNLTKHDANQALDCIDTILPGEQQPNLELVSAIEECRSLAVEMEMGRTAKNPVMRK